MALGIRELESIPGTTTNSKDGNNRHLLTHKALRIALFGAKDPSFLNTRNFQVAFDREKQSMGPSKTNVKLYTVDAIDGSLKEKRHAPRQKDLVIALGEGGSVTTFYVRDGQHINRETLGQKAMEVVGQNLKALIYGSIFPRQQRWEHALHMVSVYEAQKVHCQNYLEFINPAELINFTLAQRLLHALSAERLEVVRQTEHERRY